MFFNIRLILQSDETIVNREETSKETILYALGDVSFLIMLINYLALVNVYCGLLNGEKSFGRYLAI